MGIGKMRGTANYGVNAVERSRVEEAALPRWGARGRARLRASVRADSTRTARSEVNFNARVCIGYLHLMLLEG